MPFHVSPHPVQSPFVCRSNELKFRHRRFGPLSLVIPPRPPLDNQDVVPFDGIVELKLVFDMCGAPSLAEGADSLLDSLAFKFTEGHCIPTGSRSIVAVFRRLYTALSFITKPSRNFINLVII
jgi:hypothetical protein